MLTVLLFVASLAPAPATAKLQATFIGNMAFAITDGTTTLYTDFPYQPGAFGYMTYDFDTIPKVSGALCLVTHGHTDHFDPALFAKMDAMLIAPASVEAKVDPKRVIAPAAEMKYRDIAVQPLKTPHAATAHDSYLVTWHGLRLYFTGDTESVDQLLAQKNLDAAFVSPWLIAKVASQKGRIDAAMLICYHHRSDETVPAFQGRIVPKQGQTLTLTAGTTTAAASPR